MKTTILILSVTALSLWACKKEARTEMPVPRSTIPVFIIDVKKPPGSLRVVAKRLCYDDLNIVYLRSKEGC